MGGGGAFGTGLNNQAASAPAPTTPAPTAMATAIVSTGTPLLAITEVMVVAAVMGRVKPLMAMVVGVYNPHMY